MSKSIVIYHKQKENFYDHNKVQNQWTIMIDNKSKSMKNLLIFRIKEIKKI